MKTRFTQVMENMKGLIKDKSWSVSSGFLVAVSGGVDSMCLAHLFLEVSGPEAFAIAHCNFHLRGEESDGDEQLVRSWADANGVRLFVKDFDTEAYASERGISIEMAARDLRYSWFSELCAEEGYAAVAVAHNANDNAETLLLNLLRGTGLQGLNGMALVSEQAGTNGSLCVLRPLLESSRKQIEGYAFANKVPYRVDSTNGLSDYKRNRIRNEAFPIFEKINPSFVRTLNREMGYFKEASEIVDDWCRKRAEGLISPTGRINIPRLLAEHHWKYILFYLLQPYGFNSSALASLEALLESDRTVSGKRFESPTHTLVICRDEMHIVEGKDLLQPDVAAERTMVVRGAGVYHFNGVGLKVEVQSWSSDMSLKQPLGVIIMDAAKITFPFVCRGWRRGDWLVPLGMRGRKKVSDLFADLKYDAFDKNEALMIVDCRADMAELQHVAAVVGVRVDDRYKVDKNTESIIRITIINNTETL